MDHMIGGYIAMHSCDLEVQLLISSYALHIIFDT